MKTRFYNARILTMEEDRDVFSGEVHIDGERIVYVGPAREVPEDSCFDREIDCRGDLLMPGFKNAHTHSAMTFLRSNADDLPLQTWLTEQVYPYEAKLTPEDIYTLTKLANMEYLTSGITAVMDMYLAPFETAQACLETGMRCVQVGGMSVFNQSPELLEKWYKEINGKDPLNSFRIGFHAEYTINQELLEAVADLSERYQAPVYTHCEETEFETEDCISRTGMTPLEYLVSRGVFEHGGACYHMVCAGEKDMELMQAYGIGAVTNPGSNTKLASGIAPLTDFVERGITVGIGTDGPASNNCLDMFREMFLAAGLQKLRLKDASAMPAREVLRMATVGGAKIMGLSDCDVLAPGKLADMIMLDLYQPNMQPIHAIPENIVYSGSKSNVRMTMIHGRILYDRLNGTERYHIGTEPQQLYEESRRICERIFA